MKSLAVTFARRLPRITIFTDPGTWTRTSLVIQELNTSVVPMPKATEPMAPTCGVCESEPTFNCPGSAYVSSMIEWQMPSEPLRSRKFAVQLDSRRARKILLLQLELRRQVEQPHLLLLFRNALRRETSNDRERK